MLIPTSHCLEVDAVTTIELTDLQYLVDACVSAITAISTDELQIKNFPDSMTLIDVKVEFLTTSV